ncbi:MAG TPA: phosphoenolpyruvate--protein phosphotransferase [Candidatus Udaeobacter sp.]|nr:phosphoenolpyruvate--protein phosphotransferase [Candidatus Udaeobacter sp.]
MKFDAIGASPGIGIGPVIRFEPEELEPRDHSIEPSRIDAEIERFESAVAASRRDLESIRNKIAAELGEHEASIYDAHLLMLDDPELRRAVEEGIRRDRKPAGLIFRNTMSQIAGRLDKIEDEYLRERRADVLDVERRVLRHLLGRGPRGIEGPGEPSVLVAHDVPPSEIAMLDRDHIVGVVTEVGSRTSHFAIVARGRGIPAVVSARGVMQHVRTGDLGAVDGFVGRFELNPAAAERREFEERLDRSQKESHALRELHDLPAVTLDGHAVELGVNLELPGEVEGVLGSGADGVGLFRTEFFYLNRLELPTEDEQYAAYRSVAERIAPRPVIFRTMDLGGDKVASYLGTTHETNPFLGWRGIRFALQHPEVFRAQLRALYRASAHGRTRVMFPMVSNLAELTRALELCRQAKGELDRAGQAYDPDLELGIMIETPSAVWMADVLARHADFFSIGTNDLTQYTLAMDRDNERLAHLYEPLEPAVLRSIHHTIESARAAGRWVGVCGEMAGDPRTAILLCGMGVDELSMSSFDLPRVKAAIRGMRQDEARALAQQALAMSSAQAVKELLNERLAFDAPRDGERKAVSGAAAAKARSAGTAGSAPGARERRGKSR